MTDANAAEPVYEPHEVTALYDNLAGMARGLAHGTPTFWCSCGESYEAPTWEEAGALYDEHLAEAQKGGDM